MIEAGLVLAGGLSLGAYQAGALSRLLAKGGVAPTLAFGSSIGAFHAAILAGNAPERRVSRVHQFWDRVTTAPIARVGFDPLEAWPVLGRLRSYGNVLGVRALGVRGMFSPLLGGLGSATTPAFYDAGEARATLAALIDFDLLRGGALRCAITTTDIVSGEAVTFDTAADAAIDLDVVMASGALLPSFAAVDVGGRLLGDGGFAANLPLWPLLDERLPLPPVIFAIDLFSPAVAPPRTLADASARGTDLQFVAQSRLAIDLLVREWAQRGRPGATLVHLAYTPSPEDAEPEKAFDFSPQTIARRMAAGAADAQAALERLPAGPPAEGVLDVVRIYA